MFSTSSLTAATAALSLIASSSALYSASSNANVAVYWGQGANQLRLSTFCDESSIDVIPIGFLDLFPAQGNGFPVENFGNACWGGSVYYGPGSDHAEDGLFTQCPTVQDDIPYCQSIGKKIILSLGGASSGYQLSGVTAGIDFADFLWGAYGPLTPEWTAAGGIRPLDRGSTNTSSLTIDIDGFDFDIEHASTDLSAGYIACINRLRANFASNPAKTYLITGAPQCPLPEPNMGAMIQAAQFDILWVQFYNNPSCSARSWANANPNYATLGHEVSTVTLNYNEWKQQISSGASAGAKIYIGLEAQIAGCTPATYGDYLNATEANNLIDAYKGDSSFGGIMIWEATTALNDACNCGQAYFDIIKASLEGTTPPAQCTTAVTSSTVSSTSSTSSSSSSSSTSSSVPTTTSHICASIEHFQFLDQCV
ncbi:hypothetical protein G7Y89_g10682 [Cudoniella acicularis]|uniref:chitinase n=1 Tax=Cudoniella acicularis TaxID=354080 RepID=A0A8H4RDD2_9HELO|nr:hypothetical protein G7Y89_g10682 [Cudoniella acicularis]